MEMGEIKSVGYMTTEASPWDDDYFFLVNSETITYMLPVERTDVQSLIAFLEHRLPNYNSELGLANVVHPATLTVWPDSRAGHEFAVLSDIYGLMGSEEKFGFAAEGG